MAYTQVIASFVPEIWSKKLLDLYDKKFVLRSSGCLNMEYEGEIKKAGDTVHARYLGDVTVADYDNSASPPISSYDSITGGEEQWAVDQIKHWKFMVEDLEQATSDIKDQKNKYMDRAAIGVKNTVETYVLGSNTYGALRNYILGTTNPTARADNTAYSLGDRILVTGAGAVYLWQCTTAGTSAGSQPAGYATTGRGSTVTDGTAVFTNYGYLGLNSTITGSNIYKLLSRAKKALTTANAWNDGEMWLAVPPDIIELIETSTELTHATSRADEIIQKGFFGQLNGWNLVPSNCITGNGSAASPFNLVGGDKNFLCFADAFSTTEANRLLDRFATGVRGLFFYGAKVFAKHRLGGVNIEVVMG